MGLNEHISSGSPSTLRAGTGLLPPSSTLSPLKIFDRSGISKSTLAQNPFSDTRRGPLALAGLTALAARPLDHPACAGVFGSRLLRRLTEHPCSISNDSIARACRVARVAQCEPEGLKYTTSALDKQTSCGHGVLLVGDESL
jgi:hypothetical protein